MLVHDRLGDGCERLAERNGVPTGRATYDADDDRGGQGPVQRRSLAGRTHRAEPTALSTADSKARREPTIETTLWSDRA